MTTSESNNLSNTRPSTWSFSIPTKLVEAFKSGKTTFYVSLENVKNVSSLFIKTLFIPSPTLHEENPSFSQEELNRCEDKSIVAIGKDVIIDFGKIYVKFFESIGKPEDPNEKAESFIDFLPFVKLLANGAELTDSSMDKVVQKGKQLLIEYPTLNTIVKTGVTKVESFLIEKKWLAPTIQNDALIQNAEPNSSILIKLEPLIAQLDPLKKNSPTFRLTFAVGNISIKFAQGAFKVLKTLGRVRLPGPSPRVEVLEERVGVIPPVIAASSSSAQPSSVALPLSLNSVPPNAATANNWKSRMFINLIQGTKWVCLSILEKFGDHMLPLAIPLIQSAVIQLAEQFPDDPSFVLICSRLQDMVAPFLRGGSSAELIEKINEFTKEENIHWILNGVHVYSASPPKFSPPISRDPKVEPVVKPFTDFIKAADEQRHAFATNMSRYSPLKMIGQWICGLNKPEDFYTQLVANNPSDEDLKKAFFDVLDNSGLFFLTRWFAKLLYIFATPFMLNFFDDFSKSFLNGLRTYVDENDRVGFENLLNTNLKLTNGYLNSVIGSYKRVAKDPKFENVDSMMRNEMNKAIANHNVTPKEISARVTEKIIDSYMPSLGWCQGIKSAFDKVNIPGAFPLSLTNFPLKVTAQAISLVLRIAVCIPEWILNRLLSWILKKVAIKSELIETTIQKSTGMVEDNNGLTYATLHIFNEFLDEIRNLIYQSSANQDDQNLMINDELLRSQVEMLLRAVSLASCGDNKEKLSQFVNGDFSTLLDHILYGVDAAFKKQTADGIKKLLINAYNTLMQKDYIEQKIYEFMALANQSFDPKNEDKEAEFKVKRLEEEMKMRQNLKELLIFVIHREVTEVLEYRKNPAIEKVSNQFIKGFHERIEDLLNKIRPAANLENEEAFETISEAVDAFIDENNRIINTISANSALKDDGQIRQALKCMLESINPQLEHLLTLASEDNKSSLTDKKLYVGQQITQIIETSRRVRQFHTFCFDVLSKVPFMGSIKNIISNVALDRIDQIVEGALQLGMKDFFLEGLLRHAVLLPFLEGKTQDA